MSINEPFTRENLDNYLKELAKVFRRLNGTAMQAEIVLIGGASILANYGFREMTYDMDAIISASSVMKEAINYVGDKFGLSNGWLNTDFVQTRSYTPKLLEISAHYRTYSNILSVRTVAAEYLIAMKLMSGRKYKNDISDIAGILFEHEKKGMPITYESIDAAITFLYGGWGEIPASSREFIYTAFESRDFETLYLLSRASEIASRDILLELEREYPNIVNEKNADEILEKAKQRKQMDRDSL